VAAHGAVLGLHEVEVRVRAESEDRDHDKDEEQNAGATEALTAGRAKLPRRG
jgi:hypothetical protein